MVEVYNSYELELLKLFEDVRIDLANGGDKCKELFSSIEEIIGQMDFEIRTQSASNRKALQDRSLEHKSTFRKYQMQHGNVKSGDAKSSLIGDKSSESRQRMMNIQDKCVPTR